MEGREESILDTLNEEEEDIFEDYGDVEMLDVEEGELVESVPTCDSDKTNTVNVNETNPPIPQMKNQKRRANKKNKKRKRNGPLGPNVTDINRFVLDICRQLKEKKSYMVYTAVGCLGVSALSDLVKEVDAVQACGGQLTADGRRYRNGGGILWSIIKAREPKAYKEIMDKAKEFEKQFKRPIIKRAIWLENNDGSSVSMAIEPLNKAMCDIGSDDLQVASETLNQNGKSSDETVKRVPAHERLRVPVSYDDYLLGGGLKDDVA